MGSFLVKTKSLAFVIGALIETGSRPGPVFMEPRDYYDAPIYKVLHFIRGMGLIKG
jgi:hypothetical protein